MSKVLIIGLVVFFILLVYFIPLAVCYYRQIGIFSKYNHTSKQQFNRPYGKHVIPITWNCSGWDNVSIGNSIQTPTEFIRSGGCTFTCNSTVTVPCATDSTKTADICLDQNGDRYDNLTGLTPSSKC